MTREEHLKYCKTCNHQKFDINRGIVCSLTDDTANFEGICTSYSENKALAKNYELDETDIDKVLKPAKHGKRLANYIIDLFFYLIFSIIFGFFLGIFAALFAPSLLGLFAEDNLLVNYLLNFFAGVIYYTGLETTTGRSIAKYITRTKVVNERGEKPDFKTIFIRSLCRHIPFNALSFLGSDCYGWHDSISKTRVVEA